MAGHKPSEKLSISRRSIKRVRKSSSSFFLPKISSHLLGPGSLEIVLLREGEVPTTGITVFIIGGGLQHLLSDKAPLCEQGRSYHRGDSGRGFYSVGPLHISPNLPPGGGVLGSLQVATNMKGIILI